MIQVAIKKLLKGDAGDFKLEVDFEVKEGEFVALTGASGAAKTTLLRVLAGLEQSDATIYFGRYTWNEGRYTLPPQKRNIGFVFQDYALFEHMNVMQNLLFVRKDTNLAKDLLQAVDLSKLANRSVKTLSGGQKQRVALCRALMNRPNLLLLDEPFAALDENLKFALRFNLKKLHHIFKTTTIMVTHDMQDVYALANRHIELEQGSIVKDGLVLDLIENPGTYKAKVIRIEEYENKRMALVAIRGLLIEVEVDKSVKLAQLIEINLMGSTV